LQTYLYEKLRPEYFLREENFNYKSLFTNTADIKYQNIHHLINKSRLSKIKLSNILYYNNKVPTSCYFILRNHQNIERMKDKELLNVLKNIRMDIPIFTDTIDIPEDNEVLIQLEYFLFPKIKIYF
jgi:hypothetical protein